MRVVQELMDALEARGRLDADLRRRLIQKGFLFPFGETFGVTDDGAAAHWDAVANEDPPLQAAMPEGSPGSLDPFEEVA